MSDATAILTVLRPPISQFRLKRRELLAKARTARLAYRLATSAQSEAIKQLLKVQDDLADMRRRDMQQRADDFAEWASGRGAEIGVATLAAIREGRQS